MITRQGALAALLAAGALLTPAVASADPYVVKQCSPGTGAAEGWAPSNQGAWTAAVNHCSSGNPMSVAWTSAVSHPNGNGATLSFNAAANTVLERFRARRTATLPADKPFASPTLTIASNTNGIFDYVGGVGGPGWLTAPQDGIVTANLSNSASVWVTLQCGGAASGFTCTQADARGTLSDIEITADDNASPNLTATPSGSVTTQPVLHGREEITLTAVDQGAGLGRVLVLQDNIIKGAEILDSNGGKCTDLDPGPGYAYTQRVPCKLAASGTYPIDTAVLSDGPHNLKLQIQDAAGNTTTAVNRTAIFDNHPPIIGPVNVTGTPQEGQTLACSATVDGQSPTVTYKWLRSNVDGSGQTEIPGATNSTYTATAADVGKKLICKITATDQGGTASNSSTVTTGPFDNGGTITPKPVTGTPVEDGKKPDEGKKPGAVTDAPVPNNGENATQTAVVKAYWSLGGKGKAAKINYGFKPTIRGTVISSAGRPIVGAAVDVVAQSVVPGRPAVIKTGLITRSKGRFTYKLPSGVDSRSISFRYRPNLTSPTIGGEDHVQLRVRAGVKLGMGGGGARIASVSPTLRFTGRLYGLGNRGQLVEIRVKKGTKWVVVGKPVRTNSKGRFTLTYRAAGRLPHGTVFSFRATSRKNKSFGYLTGTSKTIKTKVA